MEFQDRIINDSKITPSGNGNLERNMSCVAPTYSQKWWVAVMMGMLFFILSSPVIYSGYNKVFKREKVKISLGVLLINSLLFTMIVRFLLW